MAQHLCLFENEEEYNNFTDFGYPNVSLIKDKNLVIYKNSGNDTSKNLITFTINEFEYQAEEEMTWEEWVNSEYNTNIQGQDNQKDYIIKNNNVVYTGGGGKVCSEGSRLHPGSPVLKTDVIINQYSYEHGLSTD